MNIYLQEFLGTALLVLLGNGVVANVVLDKTKGQNSGWIVITFGWAMAVFIAGATIGGHLNPAVTIAMLIQQQISAADTAAYIVCQIAGAMLGTTLVWIHYKDHYDVTEDAGAKLATFSTAPAIRNTISNLLGEIIGTFILVMACLRFATGSSDVLGASTCLPIALTVLGIGLCLGGTTGYAINPARDLGPRIMHALLPIKNKGGSDWNYAWIPIIAPIIGAILAVVVNGVL
jgi:glycerol uptake facilitator protein